MQVDEMPRRSGRLSKGPESDGLSVKKPDELVDVGHKKGTFYTAAHNKPKASERFCMGVLKTAKNVYDHAELLRMWTDFCGGEPEEPNAKEGENIDQFMMRDGVLECVNMHNKEFRKYDNRKKMFGYLKTCMKGAQKK